MIVDFSQLCGRLMVLVLFRGELWSVKLIERGLKIEYGPKRDPLKQSLKNRNRTSEVSYWTVYNSFNYYCHRLTIVTRSIVKYR